MQVFKLLGKFCNSFEAVKPCLKGNDFLNDEVPARLWYGSFGTAGLPGRWLVSLYTDEL